MDQWLDSASFEHWLKLFGAAAIGGAVGLVIYSYVVSRLEAHGGIQATGAI